MLTATDLNIHIKDPSPAVFETWPLILSALNEQEINAPFVQVAAAATLQIECATWQPMVEKRASRNLQPEVAKCQDRYWSTGYWGRGFIQLTWEKNYRKYGEILGLDLLARPELALMPLHAARIFAAYFKEEGVAGAAMAQNWRQVRRLVNGPGMLHWDRWNAHVTRLLDVIHA